MSNTRISLNAELTGLATIYAIHIRQRSHAYVVQVQSKDTMIDKVNSSHRCEMTNA